MKTDVTHIVQNQSSREGGRPKLIVLHTTEGFDNDQGLVNLGHFFDTASVAASSHIANDRRGRDARYVADEMKSWTQCNLNPVALSIEQIGYSAFTTDEWMRQRTRQLKNTAIWVAYWSKRYDIPISMGKNSGSTATKPGVVQHKHLGAAGCGHSDCGPGYPMRYVLLLARLIREEHFEKNGDSRKAKRIRKKVNRIRKRYGLPKMGLPKS